jgi:ABC-2 type transport system permease protein
MNGARQTWLVAARELRERGRSRGFLASLVLMLLAVTTAIVLPAVLDRGPGTKDVGVTGAAPAALGPALQAQGEAVDTTIRLHRYATLADGQSAVRDGDIDVLVVEARRLEWRRRADEQLQAVVTGAIQLVAVQERATAAGITPEELAAIAAPVAVTNVELGQVAGRSPEDETAAFIMAVVLFGAITTYGTMVLSGVVEEKSSRTVEVLLARMPARHLLAGKIAGIGALGLAQVLAAGIVALVAVALVDEIDLPAMRGGVITWAVVWFVLGYALYATVFGTLGSLASRTEDTANVTGPVTIVLVLSFVVSFAAIGSADTTWARLVSWFPLTAPLAMPTRIAMGAATWWDPIVATAITLAAIAALVAAGGRVYTRAILHTGSMLTLGEAWRGIPLPEAAGVAEDRDRRVRLLVLVAVALTAGAAVAALTRDVVIGLAVGAALYAVASRRFSAGATAGARPTRSGPARP